MVNNQDIKEPVDYLREFRSKFKNMILKEYFNRKNDTLYSIAERIELSLRLIRDNVRNLIQSGESIFLESVDILQQREELFRDIYELRILFDKINLNTFSFKEEEIIDIEKMLQSSRSIYRDMYRLVNEARTQIKKGDKEMSHVIMINDIFEKLKEELIDFNNRLKEFGFEPIEI